MNKNYISKLFGSSIISSLLLIVLLGVSPTQIQAQTTPRSFSGDAAGVIANATIGNVVTADARIADTGPLPTTGGSIQRNLATAMVALDSGNSTNSRIDTNIVQTSTSGGVAGGTPNSSQSSATVNNLAVRLLADTAGGATITATTVQSQSSCLCGACSGTTTIENLQINGVLIPIPGSVAGSVIVMPAPNTVLLPEITGVAGLTIILNEQTSASAGTGDITVNAIHIIFRDPVTGALIADIIVAQSHSDIVCGAAATAATATVAGRITVNSGSIRSFLVTILNANTLDTQVVFTNPLGYYKFNDLPVGDTYVLSVRGKGYSFTPQTFTLDDDSAFDMFGTATSSSKSKVRVRIF